MPLAVEGSFTDGYLVLLVRSLTLLRVQANLQEYEVGGEYWLCTRFNEWR